MTIRSSRYPNVIGTLFAAGALVCAGNAYGQAIVTTVAGAGFVNNAPALQTFLGNPQGVAVDSAGNVYIADLSSTGQNHILRVSSSTQVITALAGGGPTVFAVTDGPALSVRVTPTAMAMNASGNLLFLDSSRLRQLNIAQATITTLAGQNNVNSEAGNGGAASAAALNMPQQFCLDSTGNIYVVELAGYVRRIDAKTGVISTVAGNGGTSFGGDGGLATAATLVRPTGIAVDSSGNLYIADAGDLRIRKISSSGIITTVAGSGQMLESGDGGSAAKATFTALGQLAIDSSNNLYVIDGSRVRRIAASNSVISTVAGNGTAGFSGDGAAATQAEISLPAALAVDSAGNLYISDTGNRRVRKVAAGTAVISTLAGTSQNGDGGLATGAILSTPLAIAADSAGDLYIAETSDIRKVTAGTGVISTMAGGGASTQDGIPALQAKLSPLALGFDSAGNLLVGEMGAIRRIDSSGVITTLAGTGVPGFDGDGGPASAAQVNDVSALALDSSGDVVFVDAANKRLRKIDASSGVISTIAGNGQSQFSGFGQGATATALGYLGGVAVDSQGNVYTGGVATYFLLKISPAGAVSSAGGIGGCGYIGDGGPATGAGMCQPTSLAFDATGDLFAGDTTCYCVRRIAAGTGIIQTVVGTGFAGYTGDNGPGPQAQLKSVSAIAVNGTTLYVVDTTAGVVRAVTPDTPPASAPPSFTSLVSSASFQGGSVAPGELITFYGNYLGPATPATWTLGTNGQLVLPNAGIQVFFDNTPAPLVYVSAGQVNAVAPYAVANGFSAVRVETAAGTVSDTTIGAAQSAPGIFPDAIVNEDGSINGPSTPAPKGSYVQMFGTGLGQTTPAGMDGTITPTSNFPKQVYSVGATLSQNPLFSQAVPMNVFYYGPAPGLAAGVCQINAFVPTEAASGENFMVISAGPAGSPPIPFYVK